MPRLRTLAFASLTAAFALTTIGNSCQAQSRKGGDTPATKNDPAQATEKKAADQPAGGGFGPGSNGPAPGAQGGGPGGRGGFAGFGGRGGMGNMNPLTSMFDNVRFSDLIRSPAVQKEIGFTQEQTDRWNKFREESDRARREASGQMFRNMRGGNGFDPAAMQQMRDQMAAQEAQFTVQREAALLKILTKEQAARLEEIALQKQGPTAIATRGGVSKKVKLTNSTYKAVQNIVTQAKAKEKAIKEGQQKRAMEAMSNMPGFNRGGGPGGGGPGGGGPGGGQGGFARGGNNGGGPGGGGPGGGGPGGGFNRGGGGPGGGAQGGGAGIGNGGGPGGGFNRGGGGAQGGFNRGGGPGGGGPGGGQGGFARGGNNGGGNNGGGRGGNNNMSDEDRQRMREEFTKRMEPLRQDAEKTQESLEELKQQTILAIADKLSEKQQTTWDSLLGAPFDIALIDQGFGRGGRGGNNGGGPGGNNNGGPGGNTNNRGGAAGNANSNTNNGGATPKTDAAATKTDATASSRNRRGGN